MPLVNGNTEYSNRLDQSRLWVYKVLTLLQLVGKTWGSLKQRSVQKGGRYSTISNALGAVEVPKTPWRQIG